MGIVRKSFLVLGFLVLCFCFCLHVYGSLVKFVRGMITMATTARWGEDDNDSDRGLWMPVIAACPGYRLQVTRNVIKRHLLNAWPLPSYYHLHPEAKGKLLTEEQVKKWWKEEMTFDLQSILKSISVYDSTLTWKDFIPENGAKNYGILDIEETSSSLGRCYLFRFLKKFQAGDIVYFTFDLSALEERTLDFFIFQDGAELGLQGNFWTEKATSLHLNKGQAYDFSLERMETSLKQDDVKYRDYTIKERCSCVKAWELKQYLNMSCPKVCAVPQASLIINNVSMESCLSEDDMLCVYSAYWYMYAMQIQSDRTGCPPACRVPFTNMEIRADTTRDFANYSMVYIAYHTTMVMVSEEYKLFDFGAIVAAVGGSLGLFLGFSCWQFIKSAVTTN